MTKVLKLSSLKTDPVKENDGVWVDASEIPGVRFKVRSSENADYQTAMSFELQRLYRQYGKVIPPVSEMREVRGRMLAEHVLLSWEGFEEAYSKERALEVLTNPEFRRVTEAVEAAGRAASEPEFEFVETAVKN